VNRKHGILLGLLVAQTAIAAVTWMGGGYAGDTYAGRTPALELAAQDVKALRIVGEPKADGSEPDRLELSRKDDGWIAVSAGDYPADTAKVDALLEKLVSMKIGRAIAARAANHEALGVGPRSYARRITLVTDGGEHEIILGSGARQMSHVRIDNSDEVYTTKDVGVWNVRADARNFIDAAYVQVDRESLTSISIQNPNGSLNFSKSEEGWRLAELPAGVEQDAAAIGAVINALTRVNLITPVGTENKPSYGLKDGTEVTLAWVDEDEASAALRYVIGAAADDNAYYAKADDREHIVTIAKWTAEQATTKKAGDFIAKPAADAAAP